MQGLFDFTPAAGPPPKKGDSVNKPRGLVEGMKVGLKAHYVKTGEMRLEEQKQTPELAYNTPTKTETQPSAPSEMKDALKTGLRAWYTKHGGLQEATMQPSVGDGPARALGSRWQEGMPSRRSATPMEKGGSSLRKDIQNLERSLEATLATLSNKHRLSEEDLEEFRNMLADAVTDIIINNGTTKMRDVRMQATIIESSNFIGDQAPETGVVLTDVNDAGTFFIGQMGKEHGGAIVEMLATQLSSGMPLSIVRNNVAAALRSTSNSSLKDTLRRAARVLAGM